MKSLTHRDQIHGDVRFDPLAVALLDTSALQRLGRIYQLGYAHLVFRGGTHTRLSHSMGAFCVAGRLVDLLRQNYHEPKELPKGAIDLDHFLPTGTQKVVDLDARWDVLQHLVRWAALLHDVGHVPLGHTLEDEFDGIYIRHDDFTSPRMPHLWWETSPTQDSDVRKVFRREDLLPISFRKLGINSEAAWHAVMLICLHKESKVNPNGEGRRLSFRETLENNREELAKGPQEHQNARRFVDMLLAALASVEMRVFFPYMADIVANTICADYLDYLRRDPTNVGLDVLRDDRVASKFFIGKDASGSPRMALTLVDGRGKPRLDTCTGVVELVRQRFRFAEIIYYHKTKVAASAMLAKAFALIGKPPEVDARRDEIPIDRIRDWTDLVFRGELARIKELSYPAALLDPEIGDESLLLWLQQRGWQNLEQAVQLSDRTQAERVLRGLSVLQSLVRRRLYKVCLTIDRRAYELLEPGSTLEDQLEAKIKGTVSRLRKGHSQRAEIEAAMASAAGWPEDTLLLYVPPRKSQAKGIETGALDNGEVITLGEHWAVKGEVEQLNQAYTNLWRIILLVHPQYQQDVLGLSEAVDALVKGLWPEIDTRGIEAKLEELAWFRYIATRERPAARLFRERVAGSAPDWDLFLAARETARGTISTEEHADRAHLLTILAGEANAVESVFGQFASPNSLTDLLHTMEASLIVEGRDASGQANLLPEPRRALIERVADELRLKSQPSSASAKSRLSRRSPAQ